MERNGDGNDWGVRRELRRMPMTKRCMLCGETSATGNYKSSGQAIVCEPCSRTPAADELLENGDYPPMLDRKFLPCPSCSFRLGRFMSANHPNKVHPDLWAKVEKCVAETPSQIRQRNSNLHEEAMKRYPLVNLAWDISYEGQLWMKAYKSCPECGKPHPAIPEIDPDGYRGSR